MKNGIVLLLILLLQFTAVNAISAPSADDYLSEIRESDLEEGDVPDIEVQRARFGLFKDHTQKYYDIVKDETEALNLVIANENGKEDNERSVELKSVLNDYNSFLDDLGLMQSILNMQGMIKEDQLEEYYRQQVENHEKIKYGFSVKNEVYLDKIDALKDQQARSYEQALLKIFREYCIFDINHLLTLESDIKTTQPQEAGVSQADKSRGD